MRAEASNFDGIHTYIELCLQTESVQCAALTEGLPTPFGIPNMSLCTISHPMCMFAKFGMFTKVGVGTHRRAAAVCVCVCVFVCVCVKV